MGNRWLLNAGLGLALLACILSGAAPAASQTADPKDYAAVTSTPRAELDGWLKSQVQKNGGDFDHQRYHFVIGFSTGHYGSDPVQAIAMRRTAFGLLNNTFAVGDRVTPVAWEMRVWKVGDPIDLDAEPASRARFVDAVPYAPKAGSRGGHDTERALFDTLESAVLQADARSTILLLFTNTNQSQIPQGSNARLFGADNMRLKNAIQSLGFNTPVRKSFIATSRGGPKTIDVTALFPRQVVPLAGAPTTPRYPTFPVSTWQPPADRPSAGDPLPNPSQETTHPVPTVAGKNGAASPEGEESGFLWPWLILGLLVLAAIAVGIWWANNRVPAVPRERAAVKPASKGKPVPGAVNAVIGSQPQVVRAALTEMTAESRWILSQDGAALPVLAAVEEGKDPPGEVLARLSLDEKRRLKVIPEGNLQFTDLQGVSLEASSKNLLIIAPGERLICRIVSSVTSRPPTRLELQYSEGK